MSLTVPLYGFGGGGASLNFKVVGGTTKPTNPNENTIWVNTDKKIASWTFSATQPKTATEGMVWITTNTSSSIELNVLKKSDVIVNLHSAKQYVGGAWKLKNAFCYQNKKWTQFSQIRLYYYNRGDLCTADSGGWGYNSNVTFNSDHILLTGQQTTTRTLAHGKTPVPVAYKTMYIVGEVVSAYSGVALELAGLCNYSFDSTAAQNYGTVGAFTINIDISTVTKLSDRLAVVRVGFNSTIKVKIYEVYFE